MRGDARRTRNPCEQVPLVGTLVKVYWGMGTAQLPGLKAVMLSVLEAALKVARVG